MSSLLQERSAAQAPRFLSAPPRVSSAAPEIIDLAASVGMVLDRWQRDDLEVACGERADGGWSAFRVAELTQRQNGKNGMLEARQLGGLFLLNERLQTHTAHRVDTCLEHFRSIRDRIEGYPDLSRHVKRIVQTNGAEAIELMNGNRLIFKARSKASGRGFSGNVIYLDEALYLWIKTIGGMIPTLSAQPNPQLWFTSSMPLETDESEVLRRLVREGRAGGSPSLAYIERTADTSDAPSAVGNDGKRRLVPLVLAQKDWRTWAGNRERWREANPALGIVRSNQTGLSEEFTQHELDSLPLEEFLRERLGVYFDPEEQEEPEHVLGREAWAACADASSQPGEPLRLALDVSVDRSMSAFAAAGPCPAGTHVEITGTDTEVDYRPGTDWVVARAKALVEKWGGPLFLAEKSPAAALHDDLVAAKVDIRLVTVEEHSLACAHMVDEVAGRRLRHLGGPTLLGAVRSAQKRFYGNESFLWSRRTSSGDISPLVAATLAAWATTQDTTSGTSDYFTI